MGSEVLGTSLIVKIIYPDDKLGSSSMYLRGNGVGLSWSSGILMKRTAQHTWTALLSISQANAGQTAEMKALIDNTYWQSGANFVASLPASITTDLTVTFYPWFGSSPGKIETHTNVYSPQLGNTRNLVFYVPPSYYENYLKPVTNVLVMHDGQNLFDPNTAFMGQAWMCQDTLNLQIYEGKMEEVFVIGVWNTDDRMNEYTYSYDAEEGFGGKGDLYLDFLEQTVLPLVKKLYPRVQTSKENLGILGSSLGGLISCYAGWTRPSIYGRAGCMSSSFWWNNEDFNNTVIPTHSNPVPRLTFYLDSGDTGPTLDDEFQTIGVRDQMVRLGYSIGRDLFYYLDVGGEHAEKFWGARFWAPMTSLYPVAPVQAAPVS